MIVVSNSSPIMNLAVVGQLQILKQLYGKVCIPETVWSRAACRNFPNGLPSTIEVIVAARSCARAPQSPSPRWAPWQRYQRRLY